MWNLPFDICGKVASQSTLTSQWPPRVGLMLYRHFVHLPQCSPIWPVRNLVSPVYSPSERNPFFGGGDLIRHYGGFFSFSFSSVSPLFRPVANGLEPGAFLPLAALSQAPKLRTLQIALGGNRWDVQAHCSHLYCWIIKCPSILFVFFNDTLKNHGMNSLESHLIMLSRTR